MAALISINKVVPPRCNDINVVFEGSKVITQTLDPEKSIFKLLDLLVRVSGLSKARVLMLDQNQMLRVKFSCGLTPQERALSSYAIGEGITGKVLATGKFALVPDVSSEPEYLAKTTDIAALRAERIAYIAVPIQTDEATTGVLTVHRTNPTVPLLESDLTLLSIFAALIQQALRIDQFIKEKTQTLAEENKSLRAALTEKRTAHGIIGESKTLRAAVKIALQAADSQATIMLNGESGTGKEKFARMIHVASVRKDKPFITVNCAAIPEGLLESELFGHEKGAFTGATNQKFGKFEAAHEGTLFLDEIGDMNIDLQAKLLRTLQERFVQRVGGTGEIAIDVRVITATYRNLKEMISEGRFRLDLYYRLNVLPIELPPLREREGDVRLLTLYFLQRANQRHNRNAIFSPEAFSLLEQYTWPGNIRQLENVVERAVILVETGVITERNIQSFLETEIQSEPNVALCASHTKYAFSNRPYMKVQHGDKNLILETLAASRGNKTQAALALGFTPRQLQYRMRKLGLM